MTVDAPDGSEVFCPSAVPPAQLRGNPSDATLSDIARSCRDEGRWQLGLVLAAATVTSATTAVVVLRRRLGAAPRRRAPVGRGG